MIVDENRIRHLPEADRTELRRILSMLGKDAFELSGAGLREARLQAGLSLRRAAKAIWPGGPEDNAMIALASWEASDKPVMTPEDADILNRLYGLVTKPL